MSFLGGFQEDLANEYSRFKSLMLLLDPADEQEFDPEAPDDPGRQQKTSANAFKEYMAQRVDRVDPNMGIVPVFSRPSDAPAPQDGGHPSSDRNYSQVLGEQRPATPSGSMASRSSTPAKGSYHHHHHQHVAPPSSTKRKRAPPTTPAKKKKKKKRRRVTSDSEDEQSSDDDDEDPSWE